MDNTNIQVTETAAQVQKVGVGPKFIIPSKVRAVILVSLLILLGGIGVAIYQYNASKLTSTGAIVTPVEASADDPEYQLSKLWEKDGTTGDGFQIKNVNRSTSVAVFLDKPYEESQAKFQTWLKDNGFGNVSPDKILYFHNP